MAWGRALHIPGAVLQHLLQVPGGCTALEVRWVWDYSTGQGTAPTFLWSTAVFAPARPLSCPVSSQLSLRAPGQPALPLHLLILTLHNARGFLTFLMEKELEANSLHFLCSKRETVQKSQELQVGALGLWQTHPPVPEVGPGLQQHSRQCHMDYTAWLKAEPRLCLTGGTELIQQLQGGGTAPSQGMLTSLT